MRWSALFDDLEGQLAAARAVEFEDEVLELAEAERARIDLAARVAGSLDRPLSLVLSSGERLTGEVTDASRDWALMEAGGREHLIRLAAIVAILGAPHRAVPIEGVERRLTLGHALRGLSHDGAQVRVVTIAGEYPGRISWVGADHLDVVADDRRSTTVVAFAALIQVTSLGGAR